MTATQNSIDSYFELMDTGELGDKQIAVLNFIRRYPNCSYNDISRVLHMHHNTVTARIKELRDMGYIKLSGSKIDEMTHKANNTYRVREKDEEPDDTTNSAQPKIPEAIKNFLIKAVRKENDTNMMDIRANGVEWQAKTTGEHISLKYGSFISIRNIWVACEDIAQNRFIVSGVNFTVFFRLN